MEVSDSPDIDGVLARRGLRMVFQPIVDGRQRCVFGYEALVRTGRDEAPVTPDALFAAASRAGRLAELDMLCRELAVARFAQLELPGKLFLNVDPEVLLRADESAGDMATLVAANGLRPQQVVMEITEQRRIDDYGRLRRVLTDYSAGGFSVALDDLGAGSAGLHHWSELPVDYLKIDRSFIEGIDRREQKRAFLRSIMKVARELGSRVIVEGVERAEEYRALWQMGLDLAQGYFFSRPQPEPPRQLDHLLPASFCPVPLSPVATPSIATIAVRGALIDPDTPAEAALELFSRDEGRLLIPVVDDEGRLLGAVWRDDFLVRMAHQYGHALFARRPVSRFVSGDYIRVRNSEPLDAVSRRLTETGAIHHKQVLLVVDDGDRYRGEVSLIELLRHITQLQVDHARYANPLTGLPGNVPIQRAVDACLEDGGHFALAYVDLDHFKAINDVYGHATGDDVILCCAEILRQCVDPERDFVGHVGGDDFVILFRSEGWRGRCERICRLMEERGRWFYGQEARRLGRLRLRDHDGMQRQVPLVSVSIGVIPVSPRRQPGTTYRGISDRAASAKACAKRVPGSHVFVEGEGSTTSGRLSGFTSIG